MNFQSWSIIFCDTDEVGDLQPPFSKLALNSKIYTDSADEPMSIAEIETCTFLSKKEMAEIIATLITLFVSRARSDQVNEIDCTKSLIFNYNDDSRPEEQADRKIWKGKWHQQDHDGNFKAIDLAKSIKAYYERGELNLGDERPLDPRYENQFQFGE